MASWNAYDRQEARRHACKGSFRPTVYKVQVDDDHAQWRYQIAAQALGMRQVAGFFVLCAEYVIRHHRRLAEVRRSIRGREKELRRQKRQRAREDKAATRAALKAWKGPKPAEPAAPRGRKA